MLLGQPVLRDAKRQLGDGTTQARTSPGGVSGLGEMEMISAGVYFTLASPRVTDEKTTGGGLAWGLNKNRQVGEETTTACGAANDPCSTTPVVVRDLTGWDQMYGGGFHTLARRPDGSLIAWGGNWDGQLGDGSTTDSYAPVEVQGLGSVRDAAAGRKFSIAARSDGTVWTWGSNEYAQLGDGTTTRRLLPSQVPGISGVTAVAAGEYHSLALKSDGTVWAWGRNVNGQLGDGTTTQRTAPVQVVGPGGTGYLTGIVAIASKGEHSLALKSDGTVWAWGSNSGGKLGDGTTTNRLFPVQVKGPGGVGLLTGIEAIGSGLHHSIAMGADGGVWLWGSNSYGQIGDGTTTDRYYPTVPSGLGEVQDVVGGYNHTVALGADGTVWSWGRNEYGQLGDGSASARLSPQQVPGISRVTAIAAGDDHTAAGYRRVSGPASITTAYSYDRLYRLTGADDGSPRSYGYDPAGNRSLKDTTGYSMTGPTGSPRRAGSATRWTPTATWSPEGPTPSATTGPTASRRQAWAGHRAASFTTGTASAPPRRGGHHHRLHL